MAKSAQVIPRTTTAQGESDEVKDLLLWARSESIVIQEITVGSVHMVVNDLRLAASLAPTPKLDGASLADAGNNLYKEYGGKALEDMTKESPDVYEDDD